MTSQAPIAHVESDPKAFLRRLEAALSEHPRTVVLARNAENILLYSPPATQVAGRDNPRPDEQSECNGGSRKRIPTELLTDRELQILIYLAEGFPVTAIAHRCGISVHTCRAHVRSILTKLDAHSQLAAVLTAARAGILPHLWCG